MALWTSLCNDLGIKYPIILAGMSYLTTPELVAAVSNAGGLGVYGIQASRAHYWHPEVTRREIKRIKELTDKPFGVDAISSVRTRDETANILGEKFWDYLEAANEVLFEKECWAPVYSAGLQRGTQVEQAHKHGMKYMALVGTVRQAKTMEAMGADYIVATGGEAGGHSGRIGTMALVPAVIDAVKVPVIAAGGIADGRGVAAALALGAVGVWVGSRFLATVEAHGIMEYKKKLLEIGEDDTVQSRCFTGLPVRVLRNKYTDEWAKKPEQILHYPLQMMRTMQKGIWFDVFDKNDWENSELPIGQTCPLFKSIKSAAEVVEEMMTDAERILREDVFKR